MVASDPKTEGVENKISATSSLNYINTLLTTTNRHLLGITQSQLAMTAKITLNNSTMIGINSTLVEVNLTLRTGFQELNRSFLKVGEVIATISAIGKGTGASLWQDMGITGTGTPNKKGVPSVKMTDVNQKIMSVLQGKSLFNNMGLATTSRPMPTFSPPQQRADPMAIFNPTSPPPESSESHQGLKSFGHFAAGFPNLKKTMPKVLEGFKSLGPQMMMMALVTKPLTAFFEGLFAPLEIFSTYFGAFGTILSQALMPAILMWVPVLNALIPVIVQLTNAAIPLINLGLIPMMILLNVAVIPALTGLATLLTGLSNALEPLNRTVQNVTNTIQNFGSGVSDFFSGDGKYGKWWR